jgi:hypothetical protein
MQKYTQLTYEQRYHIYLLNKQGYNQTEKAIKDFKKAQALDPSAIVNEQIKLIEEELSEEW